MSADPFDGVENGAPTFKVSEAIREAVPALVALWGHSDAGKTYSALRLARGLAGPKGKIVMIDTENRRAKLYAGLFGGWSHIDMQPPFTPARYQAALDAAIRAGADVVIVDSMSHVWEGEGGVLDQANRSTAKGLQKWNLPKMAYKRMTNALFRSPVHVVFCLRAKEKFVQKGGGNNAEIASIGDVPIADARFIYEMTVACHMESGSRTPLAPVKAPDPIADVIQPGQFITESMGEQIAAWLAGGAAVDHDVEELRNAARQVAMEGSVAFRDWWATSLSKPQRAHIHPIISELQSLAKEADEEAARAAIETANSGGEDPLADPFTGAAA